MTDQREAVIQVKGLKKNFGSLEVLKGVDMKVLKGEAVVVIGPSGSGKSTLLRCLNLLETPTGGDILFHGQSILRKDLKLDEYREKFGMVFQLFNLFENLSVLDNVTIGLRKVKKIPKEQAEKKAMELLKQVGLESKADVYPSKLSGGQKQRVAIAGVMAMRPRCIILDEPTAMLDPNGRKEVIRTIRQLNQAEGITVLLITHYMEEAIDADRIIVMDDGKIVMDGKPKEIFSRVRELKTYGLDVPQATELAFELKEAGMPLSDGILSREELVKELLPLL